MRAYPVRAAGWRFRRERGYRSRPCAAAGRASPSTPHEDLVGWPRRRIASVLGGVSHLRHTEFAGRRPYRFLGDRDSASGRWEMWVDGEQAAAIRAARH